MTRHVCVVTTDGSCVSGTRRELGRGGWAAIIEDGSDGWVLRGQSQATSSTQMELVAAIEGLRALPDGRVVQLAFDCTAIMSVYDRWQRGSLPPRIRVPSPGYQPPRRPRDEPLWVELAAQYARLHVELKLVVKGEANLTHRRAHMIAQAQARAANRGEDGELLPLPAVPQPGVARVLGHAPGCSKWLCVDPCPYYRREMRRAAREGDSVSAAS